MKPNELKIISLLILNAISRQDYTGKGNFKTDFENLLKEVEDSINLYLEKESLNLSELDKIALIQNEVKAFFAQEVENFYENKNKEIESGDDYGTSQLNKGYRDENESAEDFSDDPIGPNW